MWSSTCPLHDAPYLDKGDRAIVQFDALAIPNRIYHGVVCPHVTCRGRSSDRTQRAEIDLNNDDGRLRSGQFGRVTIILQDRRGVLSIPASAVIDQNEGGRAACYRIVDGRASTHADQDLVKISGDRVEVH